jgi:ammonium transporter Rh
VAAIRDKKGKGVNSYWSDLVSMIGTLFLFAFWPSFNSALTFGSQQMRTVINTYLCLIGSVMASCIFSKMTHGGKLEMEIILNSSIAGGVAAGSMADIVAQPFGALLLGFIAGAVSSFGYAYLGGFLARTLKLHDTCGVHNLHGMPGLISALTTAIIASRIGLNFPDDTGRYILTEGRTPVGQAGI